MNGDQDAVAPPVLVAQLSSAADIAAHWPSEPKRNAVRAQIKGRLGTIVRLRMACPKKSAPHFALGTATEPSQCVDALPVPVVRRSFAGIYCIHLLIRHRTERFEHQERNGGKHAANLTTKICWDAEYRRRSHVVDPTRAFRIRGFVARSVVSGDRDVKVGSRHAIAVR